MKETGVIRRIDELGRIVIPKEIRKKLKIRNGDSIDIYIDKDKILLQKYSPLKDLETIIKVFLDSLSKVFDAKVVITDMSKVIASTIKEVSLDDHLTVDMVKTIEKKIQIDINHTLHLTDKYTLNGSTKIAPIIIYGDLFGSITITSCNNKSAEISNLINSFISDYLES